MFVKENPRAIFQPNDDGLVTNDVNEWSKEKLYYLGKYLDMFLVSMRGKKWRAIKEEDF